MSETKRKAFTIAQKAKAALEALKTEKAINFWGIAIDIRADRTHRIYTPSMILIDI